MWVWCVGVCRRGGCENVGVYMFSIPMCLLLVLLPSNVDSGSSGGDEEVPLESVKALGLLVRGMDASGTVRPLEELAMLHSEAKAAGYSKVHIYSSRVCGWVCVGVSECYRVVGCMYIPCGAL